MDVTGRSLTGFVYVLAAELKTDAACRRSSAWAQTTPAPAEEIVTLTHTEEIMSILTGGCLCGRVRYEADADFRFAFHCQCRQCQYISGTGHSSQFAVPAGRIKLDGQLHYYELKADSGNTVSSGFCPHCGNPVLKKTMGFPDTLFIHAATLDDPSLFSPTKLAWHDSAQAWDFMDPQLERLN